MAETDREKFRALYNGLETLQANTPDSKRGDYLGHGMPVTPWQDGSPYESVGVYFKAETGAVMVDYVVDGAIVPGERYREHGDGVIVQRSPAATRKKLSMLSLRRTHEFELSADISIPLWSSIDEFARTGSPGLSLAGEVKLVDESARIPLLTPSLRGNEAPQRLGGRLPQKKFNMTLPGYDSSYELWDDYGDTDAPRQDRLVNGLPYRVEHLQGGENEGLMTIVYVGDIEQLTKDARGVPLRIHRDCCVSAFGEEVALSNLEYEQDDVDQLRAEGWSEYEVSQRWKKDPRAKRIGAMTAACECRLQQIISQDIIARGGIYVRMPMEGRGVGLKAKNDLMHIAERRKTNTRDLSLAHGISPDLCRYDTLAARLKEQGIHRVWLMSNNLLKREGLEKHGIRVVPATLLLPRVSNVGELTTKYMHDLPDDETIRKLARPASVTTGESVDRVMFSRRIRRARVAFGLSTFVLHKQEARINPEILDGLTPKLVDRFVRHFRVVG